MEFKRMLVIFELEGIEGGFRRSEDENGLGRDDVNETTLNSDYNFQNLEQIMTITFMTPKGEIILPAEICKKYGFDDWMVMSVVDMGDGSILLKPHESELTKIAEQMQKRLEEASVTLDDLLLTLREERKKLFKERYGNIGSYDS